MDHSRSVVDCRGISKTFRSATILRNICLAVPEGTILGMVGPNGAGKTTLLKVLATLVIPSSGDAFVCGHHVVNEPGAVKRSIGYVSSEERSFYWRLKGRDNLLFFAALQGITGRMARGRVDRVLDQLGLTGIGARRFHENSTGMKQALAIARGLVHSPAVLLLDEPTRSLSPDTARNIRALIQRQAKEEGMAVLISSHNLREVETLADQIAFIDNGAIKAMGPLDQLRSAAGLSPTTDLDTLFDHFTRSR